MEAQLSRSIWFAGEALSAADIQMGYVVEGAEARGGVEAEHHRLRAFLDRIRARPAYRAAVERGVALSSS